jgi:hypothetical protein
MTDRVQQQLANLRGSFKQVVEALVREYGVTYDIAVYQVMYMLTHASIQTTEMSNAGDTPAALVEKVDEVLFGAAMAVGITARNFFNQRAVIDGETAAGAHTRRTAKVDAFFNLVVEGIMEGEMMPPPEVVEAPAVVAAPSPTH